MVVEVEKVMSIFTAAVERSAPDQWNDFLDEQCQGNPNLRSRVKQLLDAHVGQDSLLDAHSNAAPAVTIDRSLCEQPGTLIGPYKLLEQIGEGGMGLVYMAEQQQPVRRLVALKVIKPGFDSKQTIARFEAERQALAMMDHPNIAKVHVAGTTETGRPYFVMELVRGIPLNEFCDQKRLTVRERLQLFVQVCQAVQHAHQKGIIHRDLKPTNVLVAMADTVAFPKLLDFGIAKALGQSLTDSTLHTGYSQLVGTPLYMSPEQAEMNVFGVDTRSDVYSLGVLLYELLTGTTPFDKEKLTKASFDEMRRMIREDEPPRPSARMSTLKAQALSTISQQRDIDPRRISATLRGELDWIVMKALEKDRSRRYDSASSLAADIQRYLSDEPVLACPPTTMYRFQKFARKHKPALATAAAIALCLILGTSVSAWQAARATTAEAQATVNATQAQEKAQEATTQRDEAQRQRDEVKALNEQLRQTLYASNMNLAKSAWDAGNTRRVDELLALHHPKPEDTDLRGFEWHYLYRLCHSELLTLKGQTSSFPSPQCVAFSPDGKRVAGASDGNTVKVWDAQTGQELLSLKGGRGYGVAFSPDGKQLAFGSRTWDGSKKAFVAEEVKVCDAQTGKELLALQGHTGDVLSVAFSPDGKRLAAGIGGWDIQDKKPVPGDVRVWDAQTGQDLFSLKDHTRDVCSVAFSPDGQRLASAEVGTIKVWNARTHAELFSLKGGGPSVAFSPDGKRLASGGKVWDAETGQELFTLKEHAQSVVFSPDGKRLACAAKEVTVLDAHTGDELLSFRGHTGSVTSVMFNSDGTKLVSGSSDGTVKVWETTTKQESRKVGGLPRSVSFSPDGKRVAFGTAGTRDETTKTRANVRVKVADASTEQQLLSLTGHARPVNSIAYSPDGKRLASASSDKTVKVWDAQTGRELLTFKGHTMEVVGVAFSPDSMRLVSCSSGERIGISSSDTGELGEVKVWNAVSGEELLTLKGHSRYVNSVAYSADGRRLATLSHDNTVKVWNAESGQEILNLKVLYGANGRVVFSPDGKRLASSVRLANAAGPFVQGAVKVWDTQTGEELLTLKGHSAWVTSVVFSPDSKRLVTASGGQTSLGEVKLWDAMTGQELLTLDGKGGFTNDVAFSPDGRLLAGTGRDRRLKIWDATPLPEKP